MKSDNFIAGAGTFWILGLGWFFISTFYVYTSMRLAKAWAAETDGCLLSLVNLTLIVCGGAAGFLALAFPYCLLSSVFGALAAPGLLTLLWIRKTKPRQAP